MPKFWASTCFCARAMAFVTMSCSMGTPSSMPEAFHQPGDAVGPEDAHEVVLERQVEPRRPGVALPAGAATQLVVDAARLVPLGADDVQPAERDDLLVLLLALLR